ncbi:augmin complex subunit dgt3 [Drosophila guanche]|uniref:Blast:Proteasome subunit alpha type-4 n=1 Tax=Drosophila guanche TaxID=7266 RepID=A0A3B0JMS1_DROGU|nr:augmin complex subunit dgt3 [Drosophila guanche]SPP74839.1 blast:Proteasome subunit alpha type-4 [Drosophila guanche]
MGDILSNCDLFKKLGIDSSNQWLLYDEKLEKFFKYLSVSITDDNILTELEALERDEMQQGAMWLKGSELQMKQQEIEAENPGLLTHTQQDVDALTAMSAAIEEATTDYARLIENMVNSKHSINNNLSELECAAAALQTTEKSLLSECQEKAKQLEELQAETCKLSSEAKKAFISQPMPALFMHQLPLEQYFLKCDSFMQYFTLYIKENFKIQEANEFKTAEVNMLHEKGKLESLERGIQYYALAFIKKKAKAKATQAIIDHLDLGQIHCLSAAEMVRETHELQLLNEHHLKNIHDTLMNDVSSLVQQHTEQRIELVLYENTKEKLQRALRRRESDQQLTKIISDALSNAELVWIIIQLDLEKKRNSLDTSEALCSQAQATWQRVQAMRSINSSHRGICSQFLQDIASQLSAHLGHNIRAGEAKSCLYEYEKFGRLLSYAFQSMLNRKSTVTAQDQLAELKRLEHTLSPFVYDSPVKQPMLDKVRFLYPIYRVAQEQTRLDEMMRHLRTEFQENIVGRMERDKLWRYKMLLWIWFLREPQRMLYAIEEVKKAAAKVPALTTSMRRPGGGLQRK